MFCFCCKLSPIATMGIQCLNKILSTFKIFLKMKHGHNIISHRPLPPTNNVTAYAPFMAEDCNQSKCNEI